MTVAIPTNVFHCPHPKVLFSQRLLHWQQTTCKKRQTGGIAYRSAADEYLKLKSLAPGFVIPDNSTLELKMRSLKTCFLGLFVTSLAAAQDRAFQPADALSHSGEGLSCSRKFGYIVMCFFFTSSYKAFFSASMFSRVVAETNTMF